MWLSLIALTLVPLGVISQECGSTYSINSEDINTQADLEALNDNCTILLSNYQITSNFTDPFILPGIVNVSRITGGGDGTLRPLSIPSFEMDDLEYIDDLWLVNLDKLETFDVPKLTSSGGITLDVEAHMALEMPALEEILVMSVTGNFTDVSFPVLRTVDHDLVVANSGLLTSNVPVETTMNVSFPLLNSSEFIAVVGRASSVSFPELSSLADPWALTYYHGSNFSLWGESVSLDLPKLATVDGSVNFGGNFSSLDLSSLNNVQKNLTITAGNPISVNLPELGFARVIRLTGQIKSIDLSGLVNWFELHVDTDLQFDCAAFLDEFDTFPNKRETTCLTRGAPVEESTDDEADDSNEESTERGNESGGDSDDDNGSAALGGCSMGALLATSVVVVGLAGLF